MKERRPDAQARDYLIVLVITAVLAIFLWLGFEATAGPVLLFNAFHKESSAIVVLVSAPGVVAGLTLRKAGNRRYIASGLSFFLLAVLSLLLILITPEQYMIPMKSALLGLWVWGLPAIFFFSVLAMISSLLMAVRAHIFEGDGPVIPYPTSKIDGVR